MARPVSISLSLVPRHSGRAFGEAMTAHGKRVLLGAVTAPWAVVIITLLWAVWYFSTSPRSTPHDLVFPNPDKPWEFVLLFSIYGIPTAYLSLIVFLPFYYIARHFGAVSYWTAAAAGVLTCLPAALFYGLPAHMFLRILLFLLPFGVGVAICFLWIVRRRAEPSAPPNGGPAEPLDNSDGGGGPPSVS